jgi:hypothetical protein
VMYQYKRPSSWVKDSLRSRAFADGIGSNPERANMPPRGATWS